MPFQSQFDAPLTRRVLEAIVAELVAHDEVAWAGICEPEPEPRWVAVEGDPERWPADLTLDQKLERIWARNVPPRAALLELTPASDERRLLAGLLQAPHLLVAVVPESSAAGVKEVVLDAITATLERLRDSFPVDEPEAPGSPAVGPSSGPGPAHAHAWLPARLPRRPS